MDKNKAGTNVSVPARFFKGRQDCNDLLICLSELINHPNCPDLG